MNLLPHCLVSPGETFCWELDTSNSSEHNGHSKSISSFTCTVEAGSIVFDTSPGNPHSPRIEGSVLYVWGDAGASPGGDITIVRITLTMNDGKVMNRWMRFKTRES